MTRTPLVVILLLAAVLSLDCGDSVNTATPGSPSSPSAALPAGTYMGASAALHVGAPSSVDFPPRNEPFDFRNQLEGKYRDQLRRAPVSTFVDIEGDIVWVQEYLRYRVNACGHGEAVQKVMTQIDGGGIQPVCGSAPSGQIPFPPRNEPFDFRNQLEAKYRDGLRRGSVSTHVDIEGDIVWIQEYIRYRVNNCDHVTAAQKVFQQIDGQGVQPVCGASPPPSPPPSPPGSNICTVQSPIKAACGTATAICNDNTYSCSQNRRGTCSSHGGVRCWICPGPLCSPVTSSIPMSDLQMKLTGIGREPITFSRDREFFARFEVGR